MKAVCAVLLGLLICLSAVANAGDQSMLMGFQNSPFPLIERQATTFFNVNQDGRRGRNTPRGGMLWEDTTYNDNRVLVSIPPHYDRKHPPVIVVFLHGNKATLERDVRDRQLVVDQVRAGKTNAVLLAPQLAVDAFDSSSGNFTEPFYFKRFLSEAANQIGDWQKNDKLRVQLKHAPVVLVAYSGGYMAVADILEAGGTNDRIQGVILMDGLYDHEDTFAKWISQHYHRSFFFSSYTEGARPSNEILQTLLRKKHVKFATGVLPMALSRRQVNFLALPPETDHMDVMTKAWVGMPLQDLLGRVRERR